MLLEQARERAPEIADLLQQVRDHFAKAQGAIHQVVRTRAAAGLAATFLQRPRAFEENALLDGLVRDRLLNEAAFMQKAPALLRFYTRLLAGFKADRMLEIGVKGGGSTAFWKQLFPGATVVGLDIDLRPHLGGDGVIYIKGDQSNATELTALADQYGPFDLVIDDGSHESAHQTVSLRTLLSRVRSGGLYVIEDVHENLKPEKGDDIWPDFVKTVIQRMRGTPASVHSDAPGSRLAMEIAAQVDDVILGAQTITLRRA